MNQDRAAQCVQWSVGYHSGGHFSVMPKSCSALVPAASVVIRKAGLVHMRAAWHV